MRCFSPLRRSLSAVAVALMTSLAAPAAVANDIDLSIDAKAYNGARPKLRVKVNKDLQRVSVDLKAPGGLSLRQGKGPAASGTEVVFDLPQRSLGRVTWQGELSVEFADGASGSMPLKFDTEILGTLACRILSTKEELNSKNEVRVSMDRTAGKVDLEVLGDDGEQLVNTSKAFPGAAAGSELTIEWIPKKDVKPMRVAVVCHADDTIFSPTVEVFPWNFQVPHEEVLFETGKAVVRAEEEPKLEAALAELNKALVKYKRALELEKSRVRLFIMGHTDTVGSPQSNEALSNARAKAIAQWFRKKGVKLPIYARGFGEAMPKVETDDEVENAQNRRVDYEITNADAPGGLSAWSRVD